MSETAANVAEVIGLVKEPLEFSHTVYKEKFDTRYMLRGKSVRIRM